MSELTVLLGRARDGDKQAMEEVIPRVYAELKTIAKAKMRTVSPNDTLQPTALVHEAYMRVLGKEASFENRAHFFFVAARAMHDIVVENARRKGAMKRGGDQVRVSTEDLNIAVDGPADDMLALSQALERLERDYPRPHSVVMLRFFVGLTGKQVAEILEITERTADRDWLFAKVFLHNLLTKTEPDTNAE
ncbi:MAG: ECF-type sigma factor [Deltaproteobacteria bacterium]